MLSIPTVSKCCCFFELSPGGIVLGFSYIILGSMVLGMLISPFLLALWFHGDISDHISEHIPPHLHVEIRDVSRFEVAFLLLPAGDVAFLFITIIAAVIFIMGIYAKSSTMCLPFVIALGVHIPLLLIKSVWYFIGFYAFFAVIEVFFVYMAYSVYYAFHHGDNRASHEAPKKTVERVQHLEMGSPARNSGNNAMGSGYQTTAVKEADEYWKE